LKNQWSMFGSELAPNFFWMLKQILKSWQSSFVLSTQCKMNLFHLFLKFDEPRNLAQGLTGTIDHHGRDIWFVPLMETWWIRMGIMAQVVWRVTIMAISRPIPTIGNAAENTAGIQAEFERYQRRNSNRKCSYYAP
jgi:hypothetical protein